MATAGYVLSLCEAVDAEPNLTLGTAVRIGMPNSSFNVEASKIIHSLVSFSLASETVAVEFLNELEKVLGMAPLGNFSVWMLTGVTESCEVQPVLSR